MPIGIDRVRRRHPHRPGVRSEQERQLDIPGLILGTGALFSLTYALIEANQHGWSDPLIVSTLVGGRHPARGVALLGAAQPRTR